MLKTIQELKDLIIFAKEQGCKKLNVNGVEVELFAVHEFADDESPARS